MKRSRNYLIIFINKEKKIKRAKKTNVIAIKYTLYIFKQLKIFIDTSNDKRKIKLESIRQIVINKRYFSFNYSHYSSYLTLQQYYIGYIYRYRYA